MTNRRGALTGLVFVVIGVAFLLHEAGVLELRPRYLLPLLVILVGVWVLVGAGRSGAEER